MATQEKRKNRRFTLHYRIRVKFRSSGRTSQLEGVTRNVSAGGLLLECPFRIAKHSRVSFTIIARRAHAIRPIEFVGEGKVVRVEAVPPGSLFAIAVMCLRPIEYRPDKSRNGEGNPPKFVEKLLVLPRRVQ